MEIKNISDAVTDFDKDEVYSFKLDTFNPDGSFNKQANLLFLAESGLYSLIMRSRKPVAKPFQRWVTKEVLPTILDILPIAKARGFCFIEKSLKK
ncbi:prophage antirepressor [Thiovulum sp. ES]|nr:prophage antirepressor [Thiovulum sp. ES]